MIPWMHFSFFGCLFFCISFSAGICEKDWQVQIEASKVELLGENITVNNLVYANGTFVKQGTRRPLHLVPLLFSQLHASLHK
jgi:hypothetical protein